LVIESGRLSAAVLKKLIRQINVVAGTATVGIISRIIMPGAYRFFMMIVRGNPRKALHDNMAAFTETDEKHLRLDSRNRNCNQQRQK